MSSRIRDLEADSVELGLINKRLQALSIPYQGSRGVQTLASMHQRRSEQLHDTKQELKELYTKLYRVLNLALQADLSRSDDESRPEWVELVFRLTAADQGHDPQVYWSEAEARTTIAHEVYAYGQREYETSENKSLGNAMRAIINSVADKIGKMPVTKESTGEDHS